MADHMDSVPCYHTPREGQLATILELQSIRRISYPSAVMLMIILNRFQPQAEENIAEEQAGFRAGRNIQPRIFYEKFLQHQQNFCHVFIDFKKAFDRTQRIMGNYEKIQHQCQHKVTESMCGKAQSAVLFNGSI